MADANAISTGNDAIRAFDVVAIVPGNQKIFAYACQTAEVDIISLDLTHRLPFALNKKLIDVAVKRNIFFEIQYSPIIECMIRYFLHFSYIYTPY